MNGPNDTPAEVDELVRSYLERRLDRLDTSDLRSRIAAGLQASRSRADARPAAGRPATSVAGLPARRTLTYVLATSVVVVIAFLGGRYLGPGSASAATILQSVRAVHSQPVDRCYQVHYVPDSRYWDGKNKLLGPSQSVLWTRGDRFFAECRIGEATLAIGRDTDGLLWVSPSRKKGIVFEGSDENLPADLATLCDINSMSLPKLVDDVLADFDFEIEERSSDGVPKTVIWAAPRQSRPHRFISAAVIEVDEATNAIERLVIWILRDGRPNGTVTYTSSETARQSSSIFAMSSRLDADAEIEVKTQDGGAEADATRSTPASESDSKRHDVTSVQRTPQ